MRARASHLLRWKIFAKFFIRNLRVTGRRVYGELSLRCGDNHSTDPQRAMREQWRRRRPSSELLMIASTFHLISARARAVRAQAHARARGFMINGRQQRLQTDSLNVRVCVRAR